MAEIKTYIKVNDLKAMETSGDHQNKYCVFKIRICFGMTPFKILFTSRKY